MPTLNVAQLLMSFVLQIGSVAAMRWKVHVYRMGRRKRTAVLYYTISAMNIRVVYLRRGHRIQHIFILSSTEMNLPSTDRV